MEYALIILLQAIGICLHVGPKIKELDKKFPDDTLGEVITEFWKADKITIFLSIVIIVLNLTVHFIIDEYTTLPEDVKYYPLWAFAIAILLGYAGQRLVYTYLGKAEQALIKKAEKIDHL